MRAALPFLLLIPLAACAHAGPRPGDDAPIHLSAWADPNAREIHIETNRAVNVQAYAFHPGQPLKAATLRNRNRGLDHYLPTGNHVRRLNLQAPRTVILVATRDPVRRSLGQHPLQSLEQALDFLADQLSHLPTGGHDLVVVAY
jgi:hypothetical protein